MPRRPHCESCPAGAAASLDEPAHSIGGYQAIDIDITADQPGLSLFRCHQQLHMDFGFMALLKTT
jgi:FtsP/CotA-like multicopper oxidase with cupredoxin domain